MASSSPPQPPPNPTPTATTTTTATTANPQKSPPTPVPGHGPITLPRLTIAFCTQCKWNLRAAYYAQELLQTFDATLGEVAILPGTGGTFVVTLYHHPPPPPPPTPQRGETVNGVEEGAGEKEGGPAVQTTVLWDRKVDGGFPETKVLKGRVRDLLEPERGLGHTDRALKKKEEEGEGAKRVDNLVGKAKAKAKVGGEDGRDAEGNAETTEEGPGKVAEGCADCR